MVNKNVAEIIIELLENIGVRRIYGVPGDSSYIPHKKFKDF